MLKFFELARFWLYGMAVLLAIQVHTQVKTNRSYDVHIANWLYNGHMIFEIIGYIFGCICIFGHMMVLRWPFLTIYWP